MKVFLINLKRSADRRYRVTKQLQNQGILYEIVEAVDGAELSRASLLEYYENKETTLPSGFLACGISHYKVYQKIVEEEIPISLILEDDVVLDSSFHSIIDRIKQISVGNEIVLLHAQAVHPVCITRKNSVLLHGSKMIHYVMPFHGGLGSTAGYIIPLSVAKKFVSSYPMKYWVDSWGPKMKDGLFEYTRIIYPYPITPMFVESSIDYIDRRSIRNHLKRLLNSNAILRKISSYRRRRTWEKTQRPISFVDEVPIKASSYFGS